MDVPLTQQSGDLCSESLGLVIVDHGSRRAESNQLLERLAAAFQVSGGLPIVEPAHMELAEPSVATAFGRCVERGAMRIVVLPYFLGPGRHWDEDIPRLAAEASAQCGGVSYLVTAPLGLDDLMLQLIKKRIEHCLAHATGNGENCEFCAGTEKCVLRGGD
jgi:sirohydrochlorin ferrochelatase